MVAFNFRKQLVLQDDQVKGLLNETQDGILEIASSLNQVALLQGTLLTGVFISTSASLVAHNLGFAPRGFILVDKTSSVDVYRDTSLLNPNDRKFIALRTDAGSATVSLWIF